MKKSLKNILFGVSALGILNTTLQANAMDPRRLVHQICSQRNPVPTIHQFAPHTKKTTPIEKSPPYELISENPTWPGTREEPNLNPDLSAPQLFRHYKKGPSIESVYSGFPIDEEQLTVFFPGLYDCSKTYGLHSPQVLHIGHFIPNTGFGRNPHFSFYRHINHEDGGDSQPWLSHAITQELTNLPSPCQRLFPTYDSTDKYDYGHTRKVGRSELLQIPYTPDQQEIARDCIRELGKRLKFGDNLTKKLDDMFPNR